MELNADGKCRLCPRACGVDRRERRGWCGLGADMRLARADLHYWEEPPISGESGSGAIFFIGCNLRCCYCQNAALNEQPERGRAADAAELARIMLSLEARGAHNINLVTPTPHIHGIIEAIDRARAEGLGIPIVYNTGAYDSVEALRALAGRVQIYLPDYKYSSAFVAQRYSRAADYPRAALAAIEEMVRQTGPLQIENGLAVSGVLVRHLVLPGNLPNTRGALDALHARFPSLPLSLMRQYVPMPGCPYPELGRTLTGREYRRAVEYAQGLGFAELYIQQADAASAEYIPRWDWLD